MFDITQIKTTFTSANGTAIPYSEFIDGIQCTVVHFIKTGLISWDDADDAVMDAVEKACRYTGRFEQGGNKTQGQGYQRLLRVMEC